MNLNEKVDSDVERAILLLKDSPSIDVEHNAFLFKKAHEKLGLPYKEKYLYSSTLLFEDVIDFKVKEVDNDERKVNR